MKELFDIPQMKLGLYRHYKGTLYRVLGVGCHSETQEWLVAYSRVEPKKGNPDIWLRPYDMFVETVAVDGQTIPRFQRVDDAS